MNQTIAKADVHNEAFLLKDDENKVVGGSYDQVVNASGYGIVQLNRQLGDKTEYHMNLKAWSFMESRPEYRGKAPLPPFYVVRGSFFHHSPVGEGDTTSIITARHGMSYIADASISPDSPGLPDGWQEILDNDVVPSSRERQRAIDDYVHDSFLVERRVSPTVMKPGVAVSFHADKFNRTSKSIAQVVPGWHSAVPTKATHALKLSQEISDAVDDHLRSR